MSKNTSKLLKPLNWGMIGCGNVTDVKSAPCYIKADGFHLVGVTNRTLAKAESFAARHNIAHVFEDASALVDSNHIDAVYIATPPDSHLSLAMLVAEAEKPCCIEKPLAPSYAESEKIAALFREKNIPLFVAYYRRSLPRFLCVKKWLSDGEIGDIRHIQWSYCRPPSEQDLAREPNWRTNKEIAYAGYFDDMACHGLNLFDYLLGAITEVNGVCANQQSLYSANDTVAAAWLHGEDVTGSGFWNFAAANYEDQVKIYGSHGMITFSVFNDVPVVLENTKGKVEQLIENPDHVQWYHVQNMREHLAGNIHHPSTGDSAVRTAWVMDKIFGR